MHRIWRRNGRHGHLFASHWLTIASSALAVLLAAAPAAAQLSSTGQWESALTCWPDGAKHASHVVIQVSGQPAGRVLMWWNPGCPFTVEEVHCGNGPVAPYEDCEVDLGGCYEIDGQLNGCDQLLPVPGCYPGTPTSLSPRLWNPADNSMTPYPTPTTGGTPGCEIINDCNGHAGLLDGRLLVVGGGCGPTHADPDVLIFDPGDIGTDPWTQMPNNMNASRWYPTATTLPDGRVLVTGGACGSAGSPCGTEYVGTGYAMVETPEIYNPETDTWQPISSADKLMLTYPYMFVLPNGKLFWAGIGLETSVLDLTSTTPTWSDLPDHATFDLYGSHGSAVTYAPGKILKCGGRNPGLCAPNGRTATIDFYATTIEWSAPPGLTMAHPRQDHNLVILPDGKILAVGGQGGCEDTCGPEDGVGCADCVPVLSAEWFDPNATPLEWKDLADATIPRGYHSSAALLSDGRVLSSGGENTFDETQPSSRSGEVFKPPYFFTTTGGTAVRPVITTAPDVITYGRNQGGNFNITMPAGQDIAKVALVRLGSATHGFDQNQRYVPLTFTECDSTTLEVLAPSDGNIAPPGHYMLFILSEVTATQPNLTPSRGKFVLVQPCIGELTNDCQRDGEDLAALLAAWDTSADTPCILPVAADLNRDCLVNGVDLALLLGDYWEVDCPAGCGDANCGAESGASGGGGESATSGGSESAEGCGGGYEQFTAWLDAGDIDSFMQWLECILGGQ